MKTAVWQMTGEAGARRAEPLEETSAGKEDATVSVSFHADGIPPALAAEMDALWQNLFASSAMLRTHGPARPSVYVARRGAVPSAILAFDMHGATLRVLSEQIAVDHAEITRFAREAFRAYPQVRSIQFRAVQTDVARLPFPLQAFPFTNDVVLPLPETAEFYLNCLGKSTRDNIKRYLKLLRRDFPSLTFDVQERSGIDEATFRAIVAFNHERMRGKNKVSGLTDAESSRLLALARDIGMTAVVRIDGRVCAGTVCYRVGDNLFMRIIAHDSRYDSHRLGLLCCYLTICECIRRGGRNYHFLWGAETYKVRLMGQHRSFDTVVLYRNRMAWLRDAPAVARNALRAGVRRVKTWLLDPANAQHPAARAVHALRATLRGSRAGRT